LQLTLLFCIFRSHLLSIDINNALNKSEMRDCTSLPKGEIPPFGTGMNGDVSTKRNTSEIATVVFVAPNNAKQAKTVFEERGWLSKRFRMTKVENDASDLPRARIALPVLPEMLHVVLNECQNWVLDHGRLEMPYSTSHYAGGKGREK
jgi:hypothetical protein